MFKRNRWEICSQYVSEDVKLAGGETINVAFRAWRAKISLEPRRCCKHDTPLVIFRESSGYKQLEGPSNVPGAPYYDRVPIPGEFRFQAHFVCPGCRVAFALCPPEFHKTSFDTFIPSTPGRAETLAKAREFVAQVNTNNCGFALFLGPPGLGKTRLACNIVRELHNWDALYVRQSEVTCTLRATYGHKEVIITRPGYKNDNHRWYMHEDSEEEEPETPLSVLQEVRFLVLDEVGCTSLANDERLLLDELIKHRYEHRKPTILISNLPLDEIKEFLGDALSDRIKEATGDGKFIVQFSGESYRRSADESYLKGLD
jgi:DNA replication protein DnaC